jgi:hypothetical protein
LQFYENQSEGKHKVDPYNKLDYLDDYFWVLYEGKKTFDLITREYQQLYEKDEWWGFYQLWVDWSGDRWLLPHLCSWYSRQTGRELPSWLSQEDWGRNPNG